MTGIRIRRLIGRIVLGLSSAFTYLPVIAGIITPMLWLLPAWYSAWSVIGFIFPFSSIWGGLWFPVTSPVLGFCIWVVEGLLFFVGFILLVRALYEMTRKTSDGMVLITSGPYQWMRHPQHLGIILLLLPLALFNGYNIIWSGIRAGDILSWSLVSFMLIVAADFEERTFATRFGSEYTEYCTRTSFLIPRVSLFGFFDNYQILSKGKPLRYLLWFVLYWCVVSLILYGFTFLELHWTR